jgi:nitroimidazol reductase NimA-like FMN-containing flavoprotein (pyridoxamine 5'-phosphate oxidase superfamily)
MNNKSTLKDSIESIIKASGFAVLATIGNGQPHASLIAITPIKGSRHLVFATYRNTLKYRNLELNSRVALLIQSGFVNFKDAERSTVLTIIGQTEEISIPGNTATYREHLKRHPDLSSFMSSPDCALILFKAQSYQLVYGIDDIRWITAEDLDSA